MVPENNKGISFLLPIFNVAPYLTECIMSIISQESKCPIEIICVDDCSTDGSYELLLKLSKKDNRIKVFKNKKNGGVCVSRNTALLHAVYDYIWFVDPDDLLTNGCVAWFYQEAEKTSADAVIGNYKRIPENSKLAEKFYCSEKNIETDALANVLPIDDSDTHMCAVWGGLFRKSYIINNKIFFREKMIAQEDTLWYYEFDNCRPYVVKTDAACYLYRVRSNSVMNDRSSGRSRLYYESMKIMMNVYSEYYTNKTYRDEFVLSEKIHHMKENLALSLMQCKDSSFVKDELSVLKKQGYYPYPFRKSTMKVGAVKKLMTFLLPIEPFFWIEHIINKKINK